MPAISAEVTTGALQAFADAWNRHDADALMSEDDVLRAFSRLAYAGTVTSRGQ